MAMIDAFYTLSGFFDRSILSFTYDQLPHVLFVALVIALFAGYATTFAVVAAVNALAERGATPVAAVRAIARSYRKTKYKGTRREIGRRHAAA